MESNQIGAMYLDARAVACRYGVSAATIWRWTAEREGFPKPTKLGPGATRWKLPALESWERSQEAAA